MTSIYIHIPFCLKKCNYCDFYSVPFCKDIEYDYISALCKSIREKSIIFQDKIKTIYFGGGTPSILSKKSISYIFSALDEFNISNDCEITLEANPTTCNLDKLKFFREYFNRISIGVQSFNDNELKYLGRLHSSKEAEEAIVNANIAGFKNISLDLMYAIPYQDEKSFEYSVNKAISLPINHISAYELTVEENTPFYKSQIIKYINEDIDFDIILSGILENNNFYKYEVSNYSKIGFESNHNINYWNNGEYLGFGAGSVGFINGERYKYISDIKKYIENFEIEYIEKLNNKDKAFENLMLGLRMIKGFDITKITKYLSIEEKEYFIKKIKSMSDYVVLSDNILSPTKKGIKFLNSLIFELDTFRK